MSCEGFRRTLSDAAQGTPSPELESHLVLCETCRGALAAEQALLARIDGELQGALEEQPSLAFLPAVRRRVEEIRVQREAARRWWLVPALATLVGVVVGGYSLRDTRGPASPVRRDDPRAVVRTDPVAPAPSRAPESPAPTSRPPGSLAASGSHVPRPAEPVPPGPRRTPEAAALASGRPPGTMPRAFVPAEDEQAVRRLARRLRGRAARASILVPEVEGPFDFALEPVDAPSAVVLYDDRAPEGRRPAIAEPRSFDRTFDKSGRKT